MPNNNSDDTEVEKKDGEQADDADDAEETDDEADDSEDEADDSGDDEGDDEGEDDDDEVGDDQKKKDDKTDWKKEALKYKGIADRLQKKKSKPAPSGKSKTDTSTDVDVDSKVQAALDKRDLDGLDVSDDVKKEIKRYAKMHKVSVLEAAKSPYIKFVKGEAEKKARTEEAAAGTKRKSVPKSDFANAKPEDFDLSTEQGRKDWAAYKEYLKTQ